MNSYQKSAAVGLFVIIGMVLFVGGTYWLRGKSIGKTDVNVIYTDVGNLKDGAPVRISGALVGRVTDIVFLGVGRVVVGLKFSERVAMTHSGTAVITSVGMLGDQVVTLTPGTGAPLAVGDTIQGSVAGGVFDKANDLADQAALAMKKVSAMLDTQLVVELRRTLISTRQFMAALSDQKNGPTSQITPTMLALQKTGARLDSTLAGIDPKALQTRLDSTMRSAGSAADRLASMTLHADSLMFRIEHGNGTISRLMNDDALYGDLRKTMQAMTDLLNEIKKNPGKIGVTVKVF